MHFIGQNFSEPFSLLSHEDEEEGLRWIPNGVVLHIDREKIPTWRTTTHDGQKCATVGDPRPISHICLYDKIIIYL